MPPLQIHWSAITLKAPALYCLDPSCATKAALTSWGMDSTRPLKLYCGIWHQDISSKSFKSYKMWGGDFTEIWGIWRPGQHFEHLVMFFNSFLGHLFGSVTESIILLKEAAAISKCSRHELGCYKVWVGGTCQRKFHMNARTQGFPTEHCLEHYTASVGLASFHSAYSFALSPR